MRKSRFSGSFYPASRKEITGFIGAALDKAKPDLAARGAFSLVAPHAGYVYSGSTAAYTYKALAGNSHLGETDTIVLVGPNHTGIGDPIAVSLEDWETPIGISKNDRELSNAMAESSDYISIDETAHAGEHSLEVQLPFLQHLLPDKRLALICMGDQSIGASESSPM